MTFMKKLNLQFEKAVRFLAKQLPISDENTRKPILFHDVRVGVYLYQHGYSADIILAGLMHDALEFSSMPEAMLKDEFGENVLRLVKANTKDDSIADKEEKTNELIKRCVRNGKDALIIKAADIADSFEYYTATNNNDQLEYCMRNAKAIFAFKPEDFTDPIFDRLATVMKQYGHD